MTAKNRANMVIVISTFSDMDTAKSVSTDIIKEKLAACASITQASSIYMWRGDVEDTQEFMVLYKTTTGSVDHLVQYIKKHHPYEIPEILQIAAESVNDPYTEWLFDVMR